MTPTPTAQPNPVAIHPGAIHPAANFPTNTARQLLIRAPNPEPPAPSPQPPPAATIVKFHEHKGLPCDPAQDGFVFSKDEIEAWAQRTMRHNLAWRAEPFLLHGTRIPRNTSLNASQ
jgi:hypothetical protein